MNTWSSSNPANCAEWIAKYIPNAVEAGDGCPGGKCECGDQGHFSLGNANDGFGIRT